MKPNLILSCFLGMLAGLPVVSAQSITPKVINATGGSGTIGTNTFEWSVGEVMVATLTGSSVIVTQGVLQPNNGSAAITDQVLTSRLDVFPNPTSSVVNIQFNAPSSGRLSYRLMDVTGRMILENVANVKPGSTTQQIDIKALASANYMLNVFFKPEGAAEQTTTYKIQKLN
jgi:hypothetical protein